MRIDTPGIYEIPAAEYHQDPCPAPSLSSSIAKTLLACSPAHARAKHPRLGAAPREESETFDLGTAAHAYILQGVDAFEVCEFHDWRTNAAKEQRDEARAAGLTPILAGKFENVRRMAEAVRFQLATFEDPPRPLQAGKPELTIVWREHNGIWCRAMLDFLHNDQLTIDDLKSTAASAHPASWLRTMYGMGADVQVAFYLRGLKAVTGKDARFRFVVVENFEPYATSVISLAPSALDVASDKVEQAIQSWGRCLETDTWPGYPKRVCHLEAPAWEIARQLEREDEEDVA